jgi:transglutaminase-like putative cysteine protease
MAKLSAAGRWQVVSGDTMRVRAPVSGTRRTTFWLPPHRDIRARFVRELQVEPGIEVEAPIIVATSRRIRNREPNPETFARMLTRWVADSIALEPTLSPPSAVAALRSRAGDADHHTHLYLALARASGLPARAVRGLLRREGAWKSHSWVEVNTGTWDDWLPLDPTSGEFPADAGHVRLSIGSVAVRLELDRLVARANLTVLSESLAARPRRANHAGGRGPQDSRQ